MESRSIANLLFAQDKKKEAGNASESSIGFKSADWVFKPSDKFLADVFVNSPPFVKFISLFIKGYHYSLS
jgi:hypothetical protein